MHPFGGTPICPRCSKAVYAAEQVMGPGRKLYHKPCLACTLCNKRLDSYTLLEHDQEPYCKSCHVKNFGTRDLRQANLPQAPRASSPPLSPTRANGRFGSVSPPPALRSPIGTSIVSPRLQPNRTLTSPTSPTFRGNGNTTPPKVEPVDEAEAEEARDTLEEELPSTTPAKARPISVDAPLSSGDLESTQTNGNHFRGGVTLGRSSSSVTAAVMEGYAAAKPLMQTATGTRYGAALGDYSRGSFATNATGSSPRKWGASNPSCPKCEKSVYFAEQIKAVGKTWHKNCLRCTECNTLLDSTRLRDHDGTPLCGRCYNKLHGPAGNGYALLGKAGG
ncbi:cysteine and glycine-rich protein 3 (cardiac lim protein) [Moniliophthora roreri MCA 2997]|uniref:Cysteine-rich protein 1 n=1 Tax=Moniliophthora roreri (strain MCA 2997) TaxID=1381753 RepID=V2Y7Q5_MONRO|nr:cysteine and glycine-rich protein 3 (cardiac lim protein) [Moniliophthora roreri MCA 2997]